MIYIGLILLLFLSHLLLGHSIMLFSLGDYTGYGSFFLLSIIFWFTYFYYYKKFPSITFVGFLGGFSYMVSGLVTQLRFDISPSMTDYLGLSIAVLGLAFICYGDHILKENIKID